MASKDLTTYADKKPTSLHVAYAEWLTEQTGVKVDVNTVRLALVLHSTFQRSPENKARNAKAKADRQAALKAKAEKAKQDKASAPSKKAVAKKTAAPAKKATVVTPITAGKKTAAKKVAKKTAVRATEAAF